MAEPEGPVSGVWRPDYGLTDEYRMKILREAERSSAKKAADMFNVRFNTVYRWRSRLRQEELHR